MEINLLSNRFVVNMRQLGAFFDSIKYERRDVGVITDKKMVPFTILETVIVVI